MSWHCWSVIIARADQYQAAFPSTSRSSFGRERRKGQLYTALRFTSSGRERASEPSFVRSGFIVLAALGGHFSWAFN